MDDDIVEDFEDEAEDEIEVEEDANLEEEPAEEEADPYAEEAMKYGWKPQDDWKGDGKPMSAEQWMTRGPGTSRKLSDELAALKAELSETKENSQRALRATKAAADARIEAEISRIKEEKRRAVEVGDLETYEALDEEESKVSKPDNSGEQEIVAEWASRNSWFNTDPIMQGAAVALYSDAERQGIKSAEKKLEYVERRMKEEMPSKFGIEAPKPKRSVSPVEGGGRPVRKTGGAKGWDDIPTSDRKQAIEQIEDGDFEHLAKKHNISAKEAFAKLYWSQ